MENTEKLSLAIIRVHSEASELEGRWRGTHAEIAYMRRVSHDLLEVFADKALCELSGQSFFYSELEAIKSVKDLNTDPRNFGPVVSPRHTKAMIVCASALAAKLGI